MDQGNLRRKDTTKGPPLRVLSLDGGGVRGYSMLIILQELMYRTYTETHGRPPRREEIPKPAEYFDLIGGTGTGGLIAIMLGRLRLDLETCMDVYVRMTRKVFETDKTFAGIPYKHTLFKASKLEEAIRECVKEHTKHDDEGNDGRRGNMSAKEAADLRRSLSVRSANNNYPASPQSYDNRSSTVTTGYGQSFWGNPEASMYDGRENRTKTAVTAVYKDTDPNTGNAILLRSYDSRKEPPPEFNCTIWQAGRATSATGLAFKPITVGQSTFIDEGAGKYNPSPQLLEEALINEWPGREMGIFVSIGTGKRPNGTNSNRHEWWESYVGGSVGSFAEAKRRLIAKIEGCEDTHVQMMNVELPKRGVPRENYCRLNVDVGVGEFGMNEWDRLSDMTINTRRYLRESDTKARLSDAAYKIAKIELMRRRLDGTSEHRRDGSDSKHDLPAVPELSQQQSPPVQQQSSQHVWPSAVELPAEVPNTHSPRQRPQDYRIGSSLPYPDTSTTTGSMSDRYLASSATTVSPRVSSELPTTNSSDNFRHHDNSYSINNDYQVQQPPTQPPPLPPKTPINEPDHPTRVSQLSQNALSTLSPLSPISPPSAGPHNLSGGFVRPPYPIGANDPPPAVNKLRKPEFVPR